jgi:hypothetical protein
VNNEPAVQFVRALCEFLEESKLEGRHPIKLDNRLIKILDIDVRNQEDPMEVSTPRHLYFLCPTHFQFQFFPPSL